MPSKVSSIKISNPVFCNRVLLKRMEQFLLLTKPQILTHTWLILLGHILDIPWDLICEAKLCCPCPLLLAPQELLMTVYSVLWFSWPQQVLRNLCKDFNWRIIVILNSEVPICFFSIARGCLVKFLLLSINHSWESALLSFPLVFLVCSVWSFSLYPHPTPSLLVKLERDGWLHSSAPTPSLPCLSGIKDVLRSCPFLPQVWSSTFCLPRIVELPRTLSWLHLTVSDFVR